MSEAQQVPGEETTPMEATDANVTDTNADPSTLQSGSDDNVIESANVTVAEAPDSPPTSPSDHAEVASEVEIRVDTAEAKQNDVDHLTAVPNDIVARASEYLEAVRAAETALEAIEARSDPDASEDELSAAAGAVREAKCGVLNAAELAGILTREEVAKFVPTPPTDISGSDSSEDVLAKDPQADVAAEHNEVSSAEADSDETPSPEQGAVVSNESQEPQADSAADATTTGDDLSEDIADKSLDEFDAIYSKATTGLTALVASVPTVSTGDETSDPVGELDPTTLREQTEALPEVAGQDAMANPATTDEASFGDDTDNVEPAQDPPSPALASIEASREPTPEPEVDPREALRQKKLLVDRLRVVQGSKDALIQENTATQTSLAEMMKKLKHKDGKDAGEMSKKSMADHEVRFQKMLASIRAVENEIEEEKHAADHIATDMTQKLSQSQEAALAVEQKLAAFANKVAATVISSRTGKRLPEKTATTLFETLSEKDSIVKEERLKFLRLRNQVQKLEDELAAKEELGDGLHFIDFEQLKIENQAYNEKIEERNEELTKLRNKITTTVQVLSHLKEKVAWLEIENTDNTAEVRRVEKSLAQKRDQVSRQKRNRDKLRKETSELQRKCGLINQKSLLRDYEARYDEGGECAALVEDLQSKHAAIKSKTQGLKVRLEQLKMQDARF